MLDLKRHLEVVVVLKWQYVMSNFCRLSKVLVLVIYLVTTCAEGTYLHSVLSPFVKTYDFIFVNKPKNRTEVNLSSKLQKLGFPIVTLCFLRSKNSQSYIISRIFILIIQDCEFFERLQNL